MPELQPSAEPAPAVPVLADAPAFDESYEALGCECADPALQIPYWGQEPRGDGA